MTKSELKTTLLLAGIYASRMLGLFLIFPTFSLLAQGLDQVTPVKIGLALSIYSLAQALLQIPAGILSDVIGRKKVLFLGLTLFLVGSVLAALTHDINVLIVARLLQGTGAVSAVCLAYVADSIRGSEHGKAMAIIGMGIAFSFILSFIIGSMLSHSWGLTGLFVFTSLLAALALLFTQLLPPPTQTLSVFKLADFIAVAKNLHLLPVNLQVFLLHMTLSASFFLIPILLRSHLPSHNMVMLYVPAILLAFILVMPIIRKSRNHVAQRLPLFWSCFAVALLAFAIFDVFHSAWLFASVLALFFFGFTFIEAMLPTRLFQIATETSRGATSGIFSVYQYGGNFFGGLVGAKLYTQFAQNDILNQAFYYLAALTAVVSVLTWIIQRKGKLWQAEV